MTDQPTKIPPSDWPWWWSKDEERYHGPFDSRHDAIMDAFADGDADGVHIMQAYQDEPRVELWSGSELADRFDEINEDLADPDGDPLATAIPGAKWDNLAAALTARTRAMIRQPGVTSWALSGSGQAEWINLNRARRAALPAHVLDLLDEIAIGFDPEIGWAESYIDEKVEQLKLAARAKVEPVQ